MNLLDDASTRGLSGIEQLQALIASGTRPAIGDALDFDLVEVGKGFAAFEGVPGPAVMNLVGTVHGGFAATLLDSACGAAVHTRISPTQAYTTLELKTSYHRPMTAETGRVRAEASLISFGRRAAFASAALTDSAGHVIATATSTLLVFERAV
ncbi:MAG: PaaI family thioesterase [Mycetocola sp.]